MRILHSPEDLERFIQEESNDGRDCHNSWMEQEMRGDIKPKEYPCAVFVYWGEGANGMFLVSDIVYASDFQQKNS